jgi:hypothetical protein
MTMIIRESDSTDLYTEYGKFITTFEQLCYTIRHGILVLVEPEYDPQLRTIVDIFLEGITAKPQMEKLYNLFFLKYSGYPDMIDLMKQIKAAFVGKLVPIRNSLAHGVISHGQPQRDNDNLEGYMNYSLFSLTHHKASNAGLNKNRQILSIDNLRSLNHSMEYLIACLYFIRIFPQHKDQSKEYEHIRTQIKELLSGLNLHFVPLPGQFEDDGEDF